MKKAFRFAIPVILIAAAFASYYLSGGGNAAYSDISRHWASEIIEEWSAKGVLTGAEGKFRPDDGLTLAELATVITRVKPLEETAENTFTDIDGNSWYAEAVLKCVKAGIIDAEGKTELEPTKTLSRETAFVMLARAFDISPASGAEALAGYNDLKNVSPEALPYFAALYRLGIIRGRNAVQLYPKEEITRAEVVAMLDDLQSAGYISENE